jgi:Protein of unknown function (DUF433)
MSERIVIDPAICHGKPVVRGTRTPVTVILNALAGGDSYPTCRTTTAFRKRTFAPASPLPIAK